MPEEERPDIIREKIKQRPLNRKKLLRRTLMTVALAVVFGVVALITFLLLEPFFSRIVNPEPEPDVNHVTLVDADVQDEVQPEDLIADDSLIPRGADENEIGQLLDAYAFDASDYAEMYASIKTVATEAQKSLAVVTSVTRGAAWAGTSYETNGQLPGLVLADNGNALLLLADYQGVRDAEEVRVQFYEGTVAEASVLAADEGSGLCVLQVTHSAIGADALSAIPVATLGTSASPLVTGQPVLALGSPASVYGSMVFGMVTSSTRILNLTDANYALLTTNLAGTSSSAGVLFNLRGEVLGVFTPSLTVLLTQDASFQESAASQITAYGISAIRKLIEALSNGSERAYLGVLGAETPADVRDREGIPQGAYITRIEMNAPAMASGIQSGDVIVRIGETDIMSYSALSSALIDLSPGETVEVTLMRRGPEGYTELTLNVTLG